MLLRRARDPTALAERHHRASHVCPAKSHGLPRMGQIRTLGYVGSLTYIDRDNEPLWIIVFNLILQDG
jgi:hypothetical protein